MKLPFTMGRYLLLHLLGKGGMGEIFLAKYDDGSPQGKICVVKRLRPELTVEPSTVRRFLDELRIVVQLRHPRICRVLDVGKIRQNYYLAMEFVDGADLAVLHEQAMEAEQHISVSDAFNVALDVLNALGYAHELRDANSDQPLNLIHRDISPENIMIHKNGTAKLIDFGLANSVLKREITQPEFVFGKMSYMAPEQARGEPIDHRIDFFALAVILYEIIVGENFYGSRTEEEVWSVCGRGDFVPQDWEKLASPIRKILGKALESSPKNRYQNSHAFQEEITILQAQHPEVFATDDNTVSLKTLLLDVEKERAVVFAELIQTSMVGFEPDTDHSLEESLSLLEAVSPAPQSVGGQNADDPDSLLPTPKEPQQENENRTIDASLPMNQAAARNKPISKRKGQKAEKTVIVDRKRTRANHPHKANGRIVSSGRNAKIEATEIVNRLGVLSAPSQDNETDHPKLSSVNPPVLLKLVIAIGVSTILILISFMIALEWEKSDSKVIGQIQLKQESFSQQKAAENMNSGPAASSTNRPNSKQGKSRMRQEAPGSQSEQSRAIKNRKRNSKPQVKETANRRPKKAVAPERKGKSPPAIVAPQLPQKEPSAANKVKPEPADVKKKEEPRKPAAQRDKKSRTQALNAPVREQNMSVKTRIRDLQKTCKNQCVSGLLRDFTRLQRMTGEQKLAFFRDLTLCERRCRSE